MRPVMFTQAVAEAPFVDGFAKPKEFLDSMGFTG